MQYFTRLLVGQSAAGVGARCVAVSLSAGILLSLSLFTGCERSAAVTIADEGGAAAEEEPSVVVVVQPVEKRKLGQTVTALGRCEAMPQRWALVTPVIEGRVDAILAKPGDQVAAGQPIVQLNTTLAQADVAEKLAARDSLDASLRALESLPRTEEQKGSKLAVDQADIAKQRAQAVLDRLRPLRERNEVPDAQIFEAEMGLKQAELQKQT